MSANNLRSRLCDALGDTRRIKQDAMDAGFLPHDVDDQMTPVANPTSIIRLKVPDRLAAWLVAYPAESGFGSGWPHAKLQHLIMTA